MLNIAKTICNNNINKKLSTEVIYINNIMLLSVYRKFMTVALKQYS